MTVTAYHRASDPACLQSANDSDVGTIQSNPFWLRNVKAVNMSLLATVKSDVGRSAVADIAGLFRTEAGARRQRGRVYEAALAATLHDLLKAASHSPRKPCFRQLRSGTFSRATVGYRPFMRVLKDFAALDFVHIDKGEANLRKPWANEGVATRIWINEPLLERLERIGVTPTNFRRHFAVPFDPRILENPIELKSNRSKPGKGRRGTSYLMPVDFSDERVVAYANEVRWLNEYLAKQTIEGADHLGFIRRFNQGDDPAFAWNKGGRLFSIAGGYQTEEGVKRLLMTINGEAVVEVDIQASHLTILHALSNVLMPVHDDPYTFDGIPRKVVKAWVAITLGSDSFHRSWTPRARQKFGSDFIKNYPIKEIQSLVVDRYPLLASWNDSSIRWGDLQFRESQIIIASTLALAKGHEVPSFPVFDSIIVPESKSALATSTLLNQFKRELGVFPSINIKGGR